MDIDFDDFGLDDAPSKPVAPRPTRFLPKSAKLIPKPEPKPDPPNRQDEDIELLQPQPSIPATLNTETTPDEPMANGEESKEEDEEGSKEDPMDTDIEEDRVIREIDVFFTPSPLDSNAQLYVMQHPLRPCWRPYELDDRCKEVRVKPKTRQVEVDLMLDANSNYDNDAPDRLRITKQTLTSWRPPLKTSYAVGVLKGNKLHLNPVHAVVQLRPSMEHLTSGRLKKNSATESVGSATNPDEITEAKATSSSKKHGKMVKPPTEQVTDAEESWISLDYHGMDSNASSLATRYRQKMTSEESSIIEFAMSPYEYINSLCPVSSTENDRDRSLSKRSLLSLPLEERFRKWLSEGPQLNRFDALKHLAPDDANEDVLEVLQCHACLVQGLWVSKSSLFQLKDVQRLARDYILLLFKNDKVITRKDLDEYRLQKEAEGYLKLFAVYKPSFNGWKLKVPKDFSFIENYPEIMRKQEKLWQIEEKKIEQDLQKQKSGPVMKNSLRHGTNSIPRTSGNTDQGAKVHSNGTPSSRPMTLSDETREALPKALQALLRKHNVCSLQLICQGLREQGILKADTSPPPELPSVIDQIAVKIRDVYVLKSLGDPTFDPLRGVVIDLFCAEPNAKLKKAEIVEAAKIQLKRDISPKEYTQVMNQLCASVKGNAWVLKSGDGNSKLNTLDIPNISK